MVQNIQFKNIINVNVFKIKNKTVDVKIMIKILLKLIRIKLIYKIKYKLINNNKILIFKIDLLF